MNFALDHFELHFPSSLVLIGEQLYDRNAVIAAEEIERNLWSFEVIEGGAFEIEILISPSKVLNYTCDCEHFTSEGVCAHIIAALYHLRMQNTKQITSETKPYRSVPKKLNIPNILNQIPEKDLKNFIRNYARKDKKFSTSLKATFARRIELENNEEKYESILNSIIRPATGVDYNISAQSIRQLLTVVDQFDAQFEDSVSLKQYKEAFFIVKAVLTKISYVNHWKNSESDDILKVSKHFHKQFRLLLEIDIPPSLERKMVDFGHDLASRSYYHVTHSEHNLLLILLDPISLESKQHLLVDVLESKLKSSLLHEFELEKLWTIRQYFIEKEIPLKAQTLPALSSHSVYRITKKLWEFKAYKGVKDFLELFMSKNQIKDKVLAKQFVKVLQKVGTKEELTSFGLEHLAIHRDVFFYKILKESYPENADHLFQTVHDQIVKKTTLTNQQLYLEILKEDERVVEVIEFLVKSKHALALIYSQAEYIYKHTDRLSEVLIALSDRYLKEYHGSESSAEMRKLMFFLRKNKWEKELVTLQKHLLKDYDDRKSLTMEIKNF